MKSIRGDKPGTDAVENKVNVQYQIRVSVILYLTGVAGPWKKSEIKLSAEGQPFEWWKSHAEAGASEHRKTEDSLWWLREAGRKFFLFF